MNKDQESWVWARIRRRILVHKDRRWEGVVELRTDALNQDRVRIATPILCGGPRSYLRVPGLFTFSPAFEDVEVSWVRQSLTGGETADALLVMLKDLDVGRSLNREQVVEGLNTGWGLL